MEFVDSLYQPSHNFAILLFNSHIRYALVHPTGCIPWDKLLTKLRVEFSDLRDHRFSHNFNCTSPICRCGVDDETNVHYLLRCPLYLDHRNILLSNLSDILNCNVEILPNIHLTDILLYGSKVYNKIVDQLVIRETIRFIKSTGRFTILEDFSH